MNNFWTRWAIALIITLAIGALAVMFLPAPAQAPVPQATVVGAGEHCGGFIKDAPVCAVGLHCQLTINNPDIGGTCVAD